MTLPSAQVTYDSDTPLISFQRVSSLALPFLLSELEDVLLPLIGLSTDRKETVRVLTNELNSCLASMVVTGRLVRDPYVSTEWTWTVPELLRSRRGLVA